MLSANATLPGTGERHVLFAPYFALVYTVHTQRIRSFSISRLSRKGNRRYVLQALRFITLQLLPSSRAFSSTLPQR
jgi:hypothetical protein